MLPTIALAALSSALLPALAAARENSFAMAASIMARSQGLVTGLGGPSELLQAGFVQKAFAALAARYPDDPRAADVDAYVEASVASVIPFVAENTTHTALSYPLDRLSNGNAMAALYARTGNETYRQGADALRDSVNLNKRQSEGGLWYYVYPNWMYLDGMYSLAPFFTVYTGLFDASNTTALSDMLHQMDLLWDHCLNVTHGGLLVHGYDVTGTAVWADPASGQSPHAWVRSLGWYLMALVDTLEILDAESRLATAAREKAKNSLLGKFVALARVVTRAADPASGAWWQVMDAPGRAGNYLESSGSAMCAYALRKGARMGYLAEGGEESETAVRAYGYIDDTFVVRRGNGTVDYNGTVSVCSLNSTASYEYYVGQPILYNSPLGSAAYILASVEMDR